MTDFAYPTLDQHLSAWTLEVATRRAVAETISILAGAAVEMAGIVGNGALSGRLGEKVDSPEAPQDQKKIDVIANDKIIAALARAPVSAVVSEELPAAAILAPDAPLLVAIDPLDGSSNVDANVSFGMIFSILPRHPSTSGDAAFLRPGSHQLAAGFVVYGPQTVLVLTVGQGTKVFTLDRQSGTFYLTHKKIAVPLRTQEYAINSSNARYWEDPIRIYVHDCENGEAGPRARAYNMRWTGSPVSDIFRILMRGGIYLYPGDSRKEFHNGRIRLIYEANPIAWIMEQAGGRATTGKDRLLDIVPSCLHQKTPLVCGSADEVAYIQRLYAGSDLKSERSPLFGRRGLFQRTLS